MRFLLVLLLPLWVIAQPSPAFIVKANLGYAKLESSGDGMFGFEKGGKFGYMDKNEKEVIPPIYSYENETLKVIPSFIRGYVRLKKDGKYGILDKTGKVIFPFEYETLAIYPLLSNHVSVSRKDGGNTFYGIMNMQNKVVLPTEYDEISADSNMIIIKQAGKYGLSDASGKITITPSFNTLISYPREGILKAEKDGKYGFVDINGNWLFQKEKSVYILLGAANGLILCQVNNKYGYLDKKGNEAIITKYDYAADFQSNGLALVGQKRTTSTFASHYGYIDKKGTEVIPIKYEYLGPFLNGPAMAKDPETNRYGYLDKTGKWAIKPVYLDGISFDEFGGSWMKMTDGKYHYIDKTGKDFGTVSANSYKNFGKDGFGVLENTDYPYVMIDKTGKVISTIDNCDGVYNFSEGLAGYKCKDSSLYGFMNADGKKVIPCEYASFTGFSEGISKVQKKVGEKYKFGYINARGNVVLPLEYDYLYGFRDGWGLAYKDSSYWYVDGAGSLKSPPRKYYALQEFRSGYSMGYIKNATGGTNTYYYIDRQLKETFNVIAKEGYAFWDDVAVIKRDQWYELMNKKGEVIKSLDSVQEMKFSTEGLMAVRYNWKWGYLDNKGAWVIKAQFDSCDAFKNGYARIMMAGKWGIIDKMGKQIFEPKYVNIYPYEDGIFIFYDGNWGMADKTGKIILQPSLYTITNFEKNRALARMGKTYTIIRSPLIK
ncbi:MAG TPA: WG repeat-containing protein [Chitinophagaceae bacterium]|nr:WG repeat-containing protein [Chitinophagaceae bacterium]